MENYINYEDGETGLTLSVGYKTDKKSSIDIFSVFLNDADIISLLSDDVILNIQLYIENYLSQY